MGLLVNMLDFWRRQKTNFKVMIARDSILKFSGRTPQTRVRSAGGYASLYLNRLGANPVQIGFTNGAISLLNVLLAVPAGWLVDNNKNIKRLYLISFALGLPAQLMMAYSPTWTVFLVVMLYYTVTLTIMMPTQLIVDIDSMSNEDRVMGLSLHRSMTAVAGVASPLLLAYMIDRFGGLETARGIRPVFIVQFLADVLILFLLYKTLKSVVIERKHLGSGFKDGFKTILSGPAPVKLMLLSDVTKIFVNGMVSPFLSIYQIDVKMATLFIFALIGVAEPAMDILFSIPAAKLVERYGRKRASYVGHIIGIVARVVLVLTPITFPQLLIGYRLLHSVEGCLYLGFDAYGQEIIPQEIRGKWTGLKNTIIGVMGVFTPVLGGLVWDVSPDYLMWLPVLQWTLLAFPLMIILLERYSIDGMVRPEIYTR